MEIDPTSIYAPNVESRWMTGLIAGFAYVLICQAAANLAINSPINVRRALALRTSLMTHHDSRGCFASQAVMN